MHGFAVANDAFKAESPLEFVAADEERSRKGSRGFAAKALDKKDSAKGAQAEEQYAEEPELDEPNESTIGLRRLRRGAGKRCGRSDGFRGGRRKGLGRYGES